MPWEVELGAHKGKRDESQHLPQAKCPGGGCTRLLRSVDGLVCLDEDVASVGSHQHQLLHG